MKEKVNYTIAVVVWVLLLCSCSGGGKTSYHVGEGDTLSFRYARNLSVVNYRDYQVAEIRNPWDTTKVLHKYILVDKNQELPKPLPEGTVVRIPLSTTVVYTAVHCALMEDLGVLNSIVGVCDVDYIIRPNILERCEKGEIVNLGSAMSPNAEQIILLAPDAILLSPFENSGGNGTFEKYGIPIIECADYMETSALARAEWIRFYGLLYGVNEVADSMFYVIENRYQYLKDLVKSVGLRPKMMCDLKGGAHMSYCSSLHVDGNHLLPDRNSVRRYLLASEYLMHSRFSLPAYEYLYQIHIHFQENIRRHRYGSPRLPVFLRQANHIMLHLTFVLS